MKHFLSARERTAAKLVTLLLTAAILLSLASCSEVRKLKSADGDLDPVGKVGDYEVPYEELRFLALSYRKSVTDPAVLRDLVYKNITANYAVLTLAEKYGLSVKDKNITSKVDANIKNQVDDDFNGSFDAYVDSLCEFSLTDHYNRFVVAVELLGEEIYLNMLKDGTISCDNNALKEKIPTDFAKVYFIYRDKENNGFTEEENLSRMRRALAEIKSSADTEAGFNSAIGRYSTSSVTETVFTHGEMLEEVENAAFSLGYGEVSDIIEVENGYYILRRVRILSDYVDSHIDELRDKYLGVLYNEKLEETEKTLTFLPNEYCEGLDLMTLAGASRGVPVMSGNTVALIVTGSIALVGGAGFFIAYAIMRKTGKIEPMKIGKNRNKNKNEKK